jgi:oxygen-dependent protoporphyrinogen oxidase
MSALPLAIADNLGDRVRVSMPVEAITRDGSRYTVHIPGGEQLEAERVILASPAYSQAEILKDMAPDIADELQTIPYPALSVCCLGYRREKIKHDLNGFGFLVPSQEKKNILGTLWDASIFPGRAPEGYVLLRSMIGGSNNPGLAQLSDEKLVGRVRKDLKEVMGVDAEPDFVRIYRHERAIPQYIVGHQQRLDNLDRLLVKYPNLFLTGNAFKGVALNECIINAYRLAEKLTSK